MNIQEMLGMGSANAVMQRKRELEERFGPFTENVGLLPLEAALHLEAALFFLGAMNAHLPISNPMALVAADMAKLARYLRRPPGTKGLVLTLERE